MFSKYEEIEESLNLGEVGANNLGKHLFSQLMERNPQLKYDPAFYQDGLKVSQTKRQIVSFNGKRYSFGCSPKNNKPEVRQVYDDCHGYMWLDLKSGCVYANIIDETVNKPKVNRCQVINDSISVKARTYKFKKSELDKHLVTQIKFYE